jgi:hypothetical protein
MNDEDTGHDQRRARMRPARLERKARRRAPYRRRTMGHTFYIERLVSEIPQHGLYSTTADEPALCLAPRAGIEPATFRLGGERSIH